MTQTVVITGASAGVGRAVAQRYAARGARLAPLARGAAGTDRDPGRPRDVAGQPRPAGGRGAGPGRRVVFTDRARDRSAALWLGTHKPAVTAAVLGAVALPLGGLARRPR